MRLYLGVFAMMGTLALAAACGSDDDDGKKTGTGGAATGGASGSGGSGGSTGGASGSGGSTGGASGSGGSTGGASGSGGGAGTDGGGGSAGADAGSDGSAGSDSGTGGTDGGTPGSASFDPANGGKLEVDGASVQAPPGAVTVATAVSGTSSTTTTGLPRAADLRGKIYDFKPDGTTFAKAVLITLPVTGTPPTGKQWVVAWHDTANAKWVPLPTILKATRAISATTHFTQFALLETNKVDTSGGCNVPAPCGGALGSHYDLGGACYTGTPPTAGALPFCPTTSVSQSGAYAAGLFDFVSAGSTYFYGITVATFGTLTLQKACVDTLQGSFGTITTCEDLEAPLLGAFKQAIVCEGNRNVECTCNNLGGVGQSVETGTYSTSGNDLTLTSSKGTGNVSYCSQNNNLYFADGTNKFDYIFVP